MQSRLQLNQRSAPAVQGDFPVGVAVQPQLQGVAGRDRALLTKLRLLNRPSGLVGEAPGPVDGNSPVVPQQGEGPPLGVGDELDQDNAAVAGIVVPQIPGISADGRFSRSTEN